MVTETNTVCVIGIWHLGSVVSTCLANSGYKVIGVDKDLKIIESLNNGVPPVFEPGMEDLLRTNISAGRLSYTRDLASTVRKSSHVLITYDTPLDEDDNVDLSPILDVSHELSQYLKDGSIIIVQSQVPIGTCNKIKSLIEQDNPTLDFSIACNPENLKLGQAIECFKYPQRIVIGADSESVLDRVEAFFDFIDAPKLRMNLKTAEIAKHALNALLATSISFINEIANLCDKMGADTLKVAEALHSDERIGPKLPLQPGIGFAGGTLSRDLKVLKKLGEDYGCETSLIDSVLIVNQRQNQLVMKKLHEIYGSVKNLNVGILGLTYKAGTSTLRRSAALEIIKTLSQKGATVKAYDPKAAVEELQQHQKFEFCPDPYIVATDADALIILTDWPEFKNLNFDSIKSIMRKPVVIDAKNMLDYEKMITRDLIYFGVGRGH